MDPQGGFSYTEVQSDEMMQVWGLCCRQLGFPLATAPGPGESTSLGSWEQPFGFPPGRHSLLPWVLDGFQHPGGTFGLTQSCLGMRPAAPGPAALAVTRVLVPTCLRTSGSPGV